MSLVGALLIVLASGLIIGWLLEFLYRSLERGKITKPLFINEQMYVFTALFSYFLYVMDIQLVFVILCLFLFTTGIEFITGYLALKLGGVRLWDYSEYPYDYKGIVCLEFSVIWLGIALVYYYFVLPFLVGYII
ncbi:MAG: putative ABC transporter permease [Minisyncoccia bacterium]